MVDFRIVKEIVMIEETEKDLARKIAFGNLWGIYLLQSDDFMKQRFDYIFILKFYTGPGWADNCINSNCQSCIVHNNEYIVITDLGLNHDRAITNGFPICIGCAKNMIKKDKPELNLSGDYKQLLWC